MAALGLSDNPHILSGEACQESEILNQLLEVRDLYGIFFFYLYKLMLGYLFGEYEDAFNLASIAKNHLIADTGTFGEPIFYFYDSLIILVVLNSEMAGRSQLLQRVTDNQEKLGQWAHYAPMNHQHKFALVEAEKHRVLGERAAALEFYHLNRLEN
ncbi:MAG: hypothetical protein AAGA60_31865 [Cyanobacteria bacterium P01_E01_bin.42]